jgi:CheY-like chemotaxis protein
MTVKQDCPGTSFVFVKKAIERLLRLDAVPCTACPNVIRRRHATTLANGQLICRECLQTKISLGIQKAFSKVPGASEFAAFALEPGHEEIGTKCVICGVALGPIEPVCRINRALSHLVCSQLEHRLSGRTRILLVESEAEIRNVLISILACDGFECQEAINREDAIALLTGGLGVDLVLSELLFPNVDGLSLMMHVKEHYPSIRFVFYTSVDLPEVRQAAMKDGADGFVVKPSNREELLKAVRVALPKAAPTPF